MTCILLTSRHGAVWLSWVAKHRDWIQHHWSQVLFTNESRFSLDYDIQRVLVLWRERDTWNNLHVFTRYITVQTRWIGGMDRNQHRWMHGPAYHHDWHFDGRKVCRWNIQFLSFNADNSSQTSYYSISGEYTWNLNNAAYGMANILPEPIEHIDTRMTHCNEPNACV